MMSRAALVQTSRTFVDSELTCDAVNTTAPNQRCLSATVAVSQTQIDVDPRMFLDLVRRFSVLFEASSCKSLCTGLGGIQATEKHSKLSPCNEHITICRSERGHFVFQLSHLGNICDLCA
jgi:hypothetical protein